MDYMDLWHITQKLILLIGMEEAKGAPTKFLAGTSRYFLLGVTWYEKGACMETYSG